MELLLPLLAAVLIGAGVFLLLSRALIRLIVGLSLISYGVNLSILIASGSRGGNPPLLDGPGPYTDPLPQALILTAIVIGFGTTALLLVLALRAYQATGTDHVQELVEQADPAKPPVVYADPERPSVSPERGDQADRDRASRDRAQAGGVDSDRADRAEPGGPGSSDDEEPGS